ncbi:hypothetical protein, partial [Mycobacterium avium]|uniref:hypothetical protein n=1 Tax=Mycobacterium avium TaxID=1764 RepID=UPI001F451A3E
GSVAGGELRDGVADLLLRRTEPQGHEDGRTVTGDGRTDRFLSTPLAATRRTFRKTDRLVLWQTTGAGQDM